MSLFKYLFGTSSTSSQPYRLQIHNHGHRCYSEGLNDYEQRVVALLAARLDPDEYYIFNNVTIPSSHSITSQIDHIVVSRFGIFVIESKDYSGWIFGSEHQNKWTQSITGKMKYQFQNPLHQNIAHVFALKEHLPHLKKCIYNVVVFSNRCEFKTNMPVRVMQDNQLCDYILQKTTPRLQTGDLLMTIGKLSMLCQTKQVTNSEHVANLNQLHRPITPSPMPRLNKA
jgi:hypothetical protein